MKNLTMFHRAEKEKALDAKMATPAEDEANGAGGAFDALDDDEGAGGLMVRRLHPVLA